MHIFDVLAREARNTDEAKASTRGEGFAKAIIQHVMGHGGNEYTKNDEAEIKAKRQIRLHTVRGKRQDAEKELTRLLTAADAGTLVDPSKETIAECLRSWLDGANDLAGKTLERYRQLADQQIIPFLGAVQVQKLRPAQVQDWHSTLLQRGGNGGKPLSARTVGHAHRVLHRALERGLKAETVSRNDFLARECDRSPARAPEGPTRVSPGRSASASSSRTPWCSATRTARRCRRTT